MPQFLYLTDQTGNPKFKKSKESDYVNLGLMLAPNTICGFNVCPCSTQACRQNCLYNSGHAAMISNPKKFNLITRRRIEKTREFFTDYDFFMEQLIVDIFMAKLYYKKKLAIRLNTCSDIPWAQTKINKYFVQDVITRNFDINDKRVADFIKRTKLRKIENIFQAFRDVQFYDYTKCYDRLISNKQKNYYLTFSYAVSNNNECCRALNKGFNVAIPFRDIPYTYWGRPVLKGDYNDLRFLDKRSRPGNIVGLSPKGMAKHDKTGFVIDNYDNNYFQFWKENIKDR